MDYKDKIQHYTLPELKDALESVDAATYPEREALLKTRIGLLEASQQEQEREQQKPVWHQVVFNGRGKEFFGIWIVNVLLTILTFGIYSAWAKVRTNRYFYSNTELDGHTFTYLAKPLQILKGRIIAVVIFVLYIVLTQISSVAAGIFIVAWLFVSPWLICQSIKFNLRMTSYRNIQFNFTGRYVQAFCVFIVFPIATLFTLYLTLPWALKQIDNFIVSNTKFGNKQFATELSTGNYFAVFYVAALSGLLAFTGLFFAFGIDLTAMFEQSGSFNFSTIALFAAYAVSFVIASSYYSAKIRNHLFNHSQLANLANFESNLHFAGLLWLRTSNLLILIFTLGLGLAWVKVRKAAYLAAHTKVGILPGAELSLRNELSQSSATLDEVADVFDVDVSLV
ncbi:YjgN family protein [Aestuariibacter sp. AA17]|uniref:YjgN family protein n=1 Tax=Fluctibacter corallii TaxID=2984329 RepID=A0ABT3A9B2_9ALTE|nr:YjgN family protein [Aestuariibacter sp. AA17]MCV2885189.1 YjgN family protein [Aestuariibacter sp. AA17]